MTVRIVLEFKLKLDKAEMGGTLQRYDKIFYNAPWKNTFPTTGKENIPHPSKAFKHEGEKNCHQTRKRK